MTAEKYLKREIDWIMLPNIWYDKLPNYKRFYIMLGLYFVIVMIPAMIYKDLGFRFGMIIFCLLGLYRITYALIMSVKKR